MQLCVMTEIQLALMKEKMTAHKYFRQNGNSDFWQHSLKFLQDHLNNSVKFPEGKYKMEWLVSCKIQRNLQKVTSFYCQYSQRIRKYHFYHRLSAVIILFQMSNKSPIYLTLN